MSIRLETFDRSWYRRELRRYTDLELILAGRQLRTLIENEKNIVSPFESSSGWKLQIEFVERQGYVRPCQAGTTAPYIKPAATPKGIQLSTK